MKPHERVYREVTEHLSLLGFERRRTSWWQRRSGASWHRIHLHKFSFTESFRVHSAVHAVGLEDEAPWLNGPSSADGWFEEKKHGLLVRRYEFGFRDSPESIRACAREIRDYIERCVLPWFEKWSDRESLVSAADSPLTHEARAFLKKTPNQSLQPTALLGRG